LCRGRSAQIESQTPPNLSGKPAITTVDLVLGMLAATATALLLALIARHAIGMPPGVVREDALIAAGVMIATVGGMPSRNVSRRLRRCLLVR
jgi:hypothetical protein